MKNFTFQKRSKKKCSCIRGQIMPTRNNKPQKVNMRVTTSQFEISGKNHIGQNVFLPSVIYPSEKKKLEQAAFWHEVKVVCCLPTPFLHYFFFINPSPCFITACFINPCFITPFFINPCFITPCFINPVHVLPIQVQSMFYRVPQLLVHIRWCPPWRHTVVWRHGAFLFLGNPLQSKVAYQWPK